MMKITVEDNTKRKKIVNDKSKLFLKFADIMALRWCEEHDVEAWDENARYSDEYLEKSDEYETWLYESSDKYFSEDTPLDEIENYLQMLVL
jgi:hypothetical protein